MKLFWSLAMRIVEIKQIFGIIQAPMLGGEPGRRNISLPYEQLVCMFVVENFSTKNLSLNKR